MANKIKSDEIVPNDDVSLPHKIWVERLKLQAAVYIVCAGFIAAVAVLIVPIAKLDELHQNAWTLITVIVSSALGFLYAARDKDR